MRCTPVLGRLVPRPVESFGLRRTAPVFTDGPSVETKEHLGGFAVVDVPDDAEARYWAGRIAVAVGWPQEVHRFPSRAQLQAGTTPEGSP